MADKKVKCQCGRVFFSKTMKVHHPTKGKIYRIPLQTSCQRCRNIQNMVLQQDRNQNRLIGRQAPEEPLSSGVAMVKPQEEPKKRL